MKENTTARKSTKEQTVEILMAEGYLPSSAEMVADKIEHAYAIDRQRTLSPVYKVFQIMRAKVYRAMRETRPASELAMELRDLIDPPVPPKSFVRQNGAHTPLERTEPIAEIAQALRSPEELKACPKCFSPSEPWNEGEQRCLFCNHVFPVVAE